MSEINILKKLVIFYLRNCDSFVGVLSKHFLKKIFNLRRNAFWVMDFRFLYILKDEIICFVLERRVAGKQVVKKTAKRPNIGWGSAFVAFQNFRGQIQTRAHELIILQVVAILNLARNLGVVQCLIKNHCASEVNQLNVLFFNHYVFRF